MKKPPLSQKLTPFQSQPSLSGGVWANLVLHVFGQNCCTWAKLVLFEENGCIRAKWLYLCKIVVFVRMVVFRQNGCMWVNLVLLGKMVVFGQNGCVCKNGCI